jgi:hypothetical protein
MPLYTFKNFIQDPAAVLWRHFFRVCLRRPVYIFLCLICLLAVAMYFLGEFSLGRAGNLLLVVGMASALFVRISVVVSEFVIEGDGRCVITLSSGKVYEAHVDKIAIVIHKRPRFLALGNQMDVIVDKKTIVHQSTILGWTDEEMIELRDLVKTLKAKHQATPKPPKNTTSAKER